MNCPPRLNTSSSMNEEKDGTQTPLEKAIAQLTTGDFNQQWQAAKTLKRLGEGTHESLLLLTEGAALEPDTLCFIVEILGAHPTPETILALVKLLKRTTSDEVQSAIVLTLASQGPALIDELLPYADHPNLQKSVLKALVQINHPDAIPGLLTFTHNEDAGLRAIAWEGLGNFHHPDVNKELLRGLRDNNSEVRGCCAKALGRRYQDEISTPVITQLLRLLKDENPKVQSLTARALGRINHIDAVKGLWQCLLKQAEASLLCKDLFQAISWSRHPLGIQNLLSLLPTIPDDNLDNNSSNQCLNNIPAFSWTTGLVLELIHVLGTINEPEFAPNIAQALSPLLLSSSFPFEQIEVKQRLISGLGHLKQKVSITPLIESLAIPEDRLRFHIIAALKGIDPEGCLTQLLKLSQDSTLEASLAEGVAIALREW